MTSNHLKNDIQLLQSYYRFLSLGKYIENLIQKDDFSLEINETVVSTGATTKFKLKKPMLKKLLHQIHKNPDKKNIFGYLVEISSFRGIFSIMRELIENQELFRNFVSSKLNENYIYFEQIIRLIRNILSHSTTTNLSIKSEDYLKQKDYLKQDNISILKFEFNYSKSLKEWGGSDNYTINISIDFNQIKDGISLLDIVSVHQLYLLSELCFNLCEIFRAKYIDTKIIGKTILKK